MNALQVGLALVCITLAVTATAPGAAAKPEHVEGILELDHTASLSGVGSASADGGVLHFRNPATQLHSATLTADRIVVSVAWQNGTEVRQENVATYQQRTDSGEYDRVFTSVDLQLATSDEVAEVLAITDTASAVTAFTAPDSGDLATYSVRDATLTRVEWEDNDDQLVGSEANSNPGFWYEIEGPWVVEDGLSSGAVTGNFTFFAHNVTLDVSSDQGSWGIHAGRDEGPGPAPGTREFSVRVVTVEVYGGALNLETDSGLSLFAPRIDASFTGRVQGEGASGQLLAPETLYQYRDAPFELDGEGDLVLRPVAVASRLGAGPALPRLEVDVAGSFQVVPTSGLVTESAPAPTGPAPDWLPWAGVLVAFVVFPLAAVAAYAGSRRMRGGVSGGSSVHVLVAPEADAAAGSPAESLETQLSHGRRLLNTERFVEAVDWFEGVVDAHPHSAIAYDCLGQACMRIQRYDRAAHAYAMCHRLTENSEHEIMGDLLRATWLAGRSDEALGVLADLATMEPGYAAELIERGEFKALGVAALESDVELDLDMMESWVRFAWREGHRQTARRVLASILMRRPEAAMHIMTNPRYVELARATLDVLDVGALKAVVRLAWQHNGLGLACDAAAHLARIDPPGARHLLADPTYEALRDDVRIQGVLRDAGTDPTSQA